MDWIGALEAAHGVARNQATIEIAADLGRLMRGKPESDALMALADRLFGPSLISVHIDVVKVEDGKVRKLVRRTWAPTSIALDDRTGLVGLMGSMWVSGKLYVRRVVDCQDPRRKLPADVQSVMRSLSQRVVHDLIKCECGRIDRCRAIVAFMKAKV